MLWGKTLMFSTQHWDVHRMNRIAMHVTLHHLLLLVGSSTYEEMINRADAPIWAFPSPAYPPTPFQFTMNYS